MNHAANSRQISDKEAVVSRKRKLEKEKKTRASMILVFFSYQCFALSVGLTFTKKRTSDILQTVRIRKFTISIDLTRVR